MSMHPITPIRRKKMNLPYFESRVQAGFPSPAEDYLEKRLDLNEKLVKSPSSTFFIRVEGESMNGAGIQNGDLLIVDRSKTPKSDSVVLATIHGEFTVKRFVQKENEAWLVPENPAFSSIHITDDMDCEIWGVVTHNIHSFHES